MHIEVTKSVRRARQGKMPFVQYFSYFVMLMAISTAALCLLWVVNAWVERPAKLVPSSTATISEEIKLDETLTVKKASLSTGKDEVKHFDLT